MTEETLNGASIGAGALLSVLREGPARTRTELVELTGLARTTVSQRLDALLRHRWVVAADTSTSSGGRPAAAFAFNRAARLVLAADLGVTHHRVAITDLGTTVLAERTADVPIDREPESTLAWLAQTFAELLAESGYDLANVCGAGIGLPGPVEYSTGRPVSPPLMPGWDRFPVPEWLGERLGVPVLVDNDVNIMALGEHWVGYPEADQLIFVKIGTGIGCGIISDGRLHRGAQGAAGDIGHIRVVDADEVVCHCGNTGCVEAVAGSAALAARITASGVLAKDGRDVVRLLDLGDPEVVHLVRQAGRETGDVLASIVNFFNPGAIVIGGDIAEAGEHFLAGVREVIYKRSLPLATRHLRIQASKLGDHAGIIGAAVMVIEHVLAPQAVDTTVVV
ncbi:ROK family transcriptional regulator [Streptosporangium sp. NBC_01756]|uniref:ROK family transcriptional regulator n=1 Tax=Streptosporangium sp. NBC_01756 TaxID=2975950 RepID=UPI002DDBDF33|nr:ROK family protein [Streptosporangium sp. NBC_01756]WSC86754.1 ROK family protein [Streptosporangium sp. NBC_01756]